MNIHRHHRGAHNQAASWTGVDAMGGAEFTGAADLVAAGLQFIPPRHRVNVFAGLMFASVAFVVIATAMFAVRDYGQPTQVEDNSPTPTVVEPALMTPAVTQ